MSVRNVQCPGCNVSLNIPVAMTNVKCPTCDTIWNINNPSAAQLSDSARAAKDEQSDSESSKSNKNAAMIAGSVGVVMMLLGIVGTAMYLVGSQPTPSHVDENEITHKPKNPVAFREVKLPEEQRRRIYADYRKVARTTVETPLMLPQGTQARHNVEVMLDKTFDREIARFAVLHDIEIDDVQEIIKEGDSKVWDSRPRSNAVRGGNRIYDKEMSEGWEKNPYIK